jgi:6-phosphofructokinase 1
MSEALQGNVVIGQSGGPSAVINQSLVGIVETLRDQPGINKILGARNAVAGIRRNDFIELQDKSRDQLERIANTPSAALGSSRDKPDEEYCKKLFEVFAENDVRYFFYIGGNDSSDTCRIVHEVAKQNNYELRAFHVPKTIDNDLVCNDHTPGWGSAAKFVAQAFMGDNLDNRALPGIKLNVVMGRHAGFLTAASILGRRNEEDGPHLVYVPEADFSVDQFKQDVERVYARHGRCLIAVSEGIHNKEGKPIAVELAEQMGGVETDSHGNPQLSGTGVLGDFLTKAIKEHMAEKIEKVRARADTFGYLQRCFVGCVSEVDQREARAVGQKAGEAALAGETAGSVTINRTSNSPYQVEYGLVKLGDVAAKTRTLDTSYIVNGNDIDESFKEYAGPIVGELPTIETFDFEPATTS